MCGDGAGVEAGEVCTMSRRIHHWMELLCLRADEVQVARVGVHGGVVAGVLYSVQIVFEVPTGLKKTTRCKKFR